MNNRGVAFFSFFCRFQLNRVPQTFGSILYTLTDVPPFGADKIDHRAHDEHSIWKKLTALNNPNSVVAPIKALPVPQKKLPMPPKKSILFEEQKVSCGKGQLFALPLIPRETRNEEW
jgi:hypothetical protein